MRQIKNFMKSKSSWRCGNPKECITPMGWKCNNEFCGCGEGGSSLPPLHNMIKETSENSAVTFGENESENFIGISIETDPETGDSKVCVYPYGVFADERYVRDGVSVWEDILITIDAEGMKNVIYNYDKRPSKIFEALNEVYKNPTDENIQAAQDVMGERIPRNELWNIIEATSENSADVLNYDGYSIEYAIESDAETGLLRVVVSPTGEFDSDFFVVDGENIWNSVFTDETRPNMKYRLNETFEFPSNVFNAINAVFQDPTIENAQAANNAIIGWKPTISNKALGEDGTYMFVGPYLYNDYIKISIDHDQEDPMVIIEGSGMFDPEGTYGEKASLLIGAFEAMDPEWIERWIEGQSWLTGYSWDLGTINSDCMSLVQAIFNNPTEENQQALITFFEEWDAREAENPSGAQLIIDDTQSDRIREGLESAEPEDVQEVITRSDERGGSWEPLVVENYYTYYLMAVSENSADVRVYVGDYMYQTSVTVETDDEVDESRIVTGECTPAPYEELDGE